MSSPTFRFFSQLFLIGLLFVSCKTIIDPPEVDTPLAEVKSLIPAFKINTNGQTILNDPKINASFEILKEDSILLKGNLSIEYRGSTSYRLFEKKSYGIEIRDDAANGISVEMLGMPAEEDWILYGPYADKTFLRNVLMYELSNQIGQYASRTKFVELYLNGNYEGIYVCMERIKRDKNRVDMKKLEAKDTTATSITGGYIIKIDKAAGDSPIDDWAGDADYRESYSFRSDFDTKGKPLSYAPFGSKKGDETYFIYDYPKPEDIQPLQKTYIQTYVNSFEKALLNDDFSTSKRTYTDFIDLDSFADFFILNELSANPDAYRLSTFLHKNRGEKLKMGPIWDFNISLGLDARSAANQWIYQYNSRVPGDAWLVNFWWERLIQDVIFKKLIKTKWESYRTNILSEKNINLILTTNIDYLNKNGAISRNYSRWKVLGTQLPFNDYVGKTYDDEVAYTQQWLQKRIQWMDTQIGVW